MKKVLNIFTDIGVNPELTPEERRMVQLSNRIAWSAIIFITIIGVVSFIISEFNTVIYNFTVVLILLIPVILNGFKKYDLAKLMLVFLGSVSIISGSLNYGYDSVFKYLMVLPISVTYIFFYEEGKWKLYTPLTFIIISLVLFEIDKFYNHNFAYKDFNHFFIDENYTGHVYESLTFGLLIGVYLLVQSYYSSILKERENELIIYKKIFDNSNEGLSILDSKGRFIKQNKSHKEVLGFTDAEALGKTPSLYMGEELFKGVKETLEETGEYSEEVLGQSKMGEKHIDVMAFTIVENDQILCVVGAIRDITKQKKLKIALEESEIRYRTLVNLMGEGLGVINDQEDFLFANPQMEKIFEVNPGALVNEKLSKFLSNKQANIVKQQTNFREEGMSNTYKLTINTGSGQVKDVQVTAASFISDNKNTGTIAVFVDITEREKILNALKNSEENLREVNATKDKLFSIIAHDLRSPFNGILGFSELLIENASNNETQENEQFLEIINVTAKKTLVLLDNLLNWARSQTGKIEFAPEKLNLSAIIRELLVTSSSMAKIKNIDLCYSQSNDIEVYADKNMLETVLRNLINNAIKFTELGGRISVLSDSDLNNFEITISDDGVGMNEETVKNIFKVASYTTSLGTANEKGAGLGLVLCKEFVNKHGGKIWVESEENKGSNFKFTIPKV
jgi:PAS domain S-box-containing protein